MIKNVTLATIVLGLLLMLSAFLVKRNKKSDFDVAAEEIVMRNIAHQILRYTGDSISAIAPVKRLSATEFSIPFESAFSFKPDSLVKIIDKIIAVNKLPAKYVVQVVERKTDKVIYGYAVMGPQQEDIVPCLGRDQPARLYNIDIKFDERSPVFSKGLSVAGVGMLSLGLMLVIVSGLRRRKEMPKPENEDRPLIQGDAIPIGSYHFFADEQVLRFNNEDIELTVKEVKILSIFANEPNKIIDRKRLQKEIWEDEGVIVGRSLDMFISRLRKKLANDPDVKLLNIHSKGYKLEINNTKA